MNIIEALQNIGLNEKEAKVYIALLQLGKATAYSIATRSNLKKPTTYVVLETLIDKGIVQKLPRAKKAIYAAISPEDLFAIVKSKIKNAEEEVLPELKSLSKGKEYKVKTSYYEGIAGIREMYSRMIKTMRETKTRDYIGFYAHGKDASPELLKVFDEFNDAHKKYGIKRRGITVDDPSLGKYLDSEYAYQFNTTLKALPSKIYDSNISIEIFNNFVQICSHRYLQATVIENPDVANVMRQIFEIVWNGNNFVKTVN